MKKDITTKILAVVVLILAFYNGIQDGQIPPEPYLTANNKLAVNESITPTVENQILEICKIQDVKEPVIAVEYVKRVKEYR